MPSSKLIYLIFFILFSCNEHIQTNDYAGLENTKLSVLKNDSYSNILKIEDILEGNKSENIVFSYKAFPNKELLEYNQDDFEYCINTREENSPIDHSSNLFLSKFEDFNCTNLWKPYKEINTEITVLEDKSYIINIALKHESKIYLYNRLILKSGINFLEKNISCKELVSKFYDNNSIILNNDVDCNHSYISSRSSIVSNLYFNGNGFTIKNAKIGTNETPYPIGFIDQITNNSYITNLNLENFYLTGLNVAGLLAGSLEDSSIENLHVDGSIFASNVVGGIAGIANSSLLINNTFSGLVKGGQEMLGGLLGIADGSIIINNSSNSKVLGTGANVAGLVGFLFNSSLDSSSSISYVEGGGHSGVLLGQAINSSVKDCFSKGRIVSDGNEVGGLIGDVIGSTIETSFSNADVYSEKHHVGGFVGGLHAGAIVLDSYATGNVEGNTSVGGFIGSTIGSTVINSYSALGTITYNSTGNGFIASYYSTNNISNNYSFRDDSNDVGVTVLTVDEFSQIGSFIGFDFENTWYMGNNSLKDDFLRPHLRFEK